MAGTLAIIVGISTLFFTIALSFLGIFSISTLLLFIIGFNLAQWLLAPYMIDLMYRVKEVTNSERPGIYHMVERLSNRAGIKTPKVMIADIPIPNAFAYGSPLSGTRVAVTTGLLKNLEAEEVEAVVGHELGHIKHRDVQVMMFASVLPAIVYYLGYSLFYSSRYRDREGGSEAAALSSISLMVYFVLTFLSLHLSRLREYYADRHSVSIVDDGARKLSEGLAKIVTYTGRLRMYGVGVKEFSNFRALLIADPDTTFRDAREIGSVIRTTSDQQLVQRLVSKDISPFASFLELFSTHPNIVKRLKALKQN